MRPLKYKNETKKLFISPAIISAFSFCMCPAMGWASERKKKYKNEMEVRGILAIQVSSPLV